MPETRYQIEMTIDREVKAAESMLEIGGKDTTSPHERQALWFQAAQVHATLALVAAVRENTARTARRS